MAITLSPSNLDKPQTGDYGTTFFPDLENAIQFANDHQHTGQVGSGTMLDAKSITTFYHNPSITWGPIDPATQLYPGVITTTVNMAFGATVGRIPKFFISNEPIGLKYVVNSTTQITIYSFDNTIAPVIHYGV